MTQFDIKIQPQYHLRDSLLGGILYLSKINTKEVLPYVILGVVNEIFRILGIKHFDKIGLYFRALSLLYLY